ncbi:MAG: hypothetical protein ABI670_08595 [Chloroflexota bacterium]
MRTIDPARKEAAPDASTIMPDETVATTLNSDVQAPRTRSRRSSLLLHVGVLIGFTLLAIIATWPLFPQLGGFVIDKGDPLYSVWAMAWQAHAFVTNPFRLFDANIMHPFKGTLAFDELSFSEAVMAAPFYYASGNPVLSHNLILFLTFPLSGYGMWLLVRSLTGSAWAGVVAGSAFAFSFYRLNHLPHMTLISTEWMPFLLFVSYRLLWTHRWKWAWALAALFAVQALSGHYLAFYSAMMLGIFFVYYLLVDRKLYSWKVIGQFAAGMAASVVVMLPVVVPFIQLQGGYEFKRNLFEVERFSNTLSSFLAVFRGNPLLQKLLAPFGDPGPWAIERAAFPGFATFLLAGGGVFGALRQRRSNQVSVGCAEERGEFGPVRKHVWLYLFLALMSALLSLGPSLQITYAANNYDPNAIQRVIPLPYLWLHDYVPGFQTMRVVARIDVLIALALSVLAGIGAFYLFQWLRPRWKGISQFKWGLPVVAIVVALLPVAESWTVPVQMAAVGTRGAVPEAYRWLAEQPKTVVMEYPMVYYKPGDPNVEMANLYQYYSTYHWQETINASTTIRPYSYSGIVVETEDCFPCPRSLDALWMLDTEYVVAHLENLSGPQRTDFEWRSTNPVANVVDDFVMVQDYGSDKIYKLRPRAVGQLKNVIPSGASVLLAAPELDPIRSSAPGTTVSGGYMAAVGYLLRNHPLFGDSRLSFGQPIKPIEASKLPDYAVLWANQDPTLLGYRPENKVWSNEEVAVYKLGISLALADGVR